MIRISIRLVCKLYNIKSCFVLSTYYPRRIVFLTVQKNDITVMILQYPIAVFYVINKSKYSNVICK
jgi:hypothetical protein